MLLKYWLAASSMAAAVAFIPTAEAGLFDRMRERREAREETKADREESANEMNARDSAGFSVADEREIGKFVTPASFQPFAAPSAFDQPLQPVPEPYLPPPAPGSSRSLYPAMPDASFSGGGPVPPYPIEGYSVTGPFSPVSQHLEGFPLYHRVEYEDLDNIHPCGVPTVVQVLDPCENPCDSCGPRCVYVKICVPPNERPRIKVGDGGREVKYKFRDYSVEIESEDGVVSVNYDD